MRYENPPLLLDADLETRRRQEETAEFLKQIRRELALSKRRLTITEEGLVLVPIQTG